MSYQKKPYVSDKPADADLLVVDEPHAAPVGQGAAYFCPSCGARVVEPGLCKNCGGTAAAC